MCRRIHPRSLNIYRIREVHRKVLTCIEKRVSLLSKPIPRIHTFGRHVRKITFCRHIVCLRLSGGRERGIYRETAEVILTTTTICEVHEYCRNDRSEVLCTERKATNERNTEHRHYNENKYAYGAPEYIGG